jgi:signal transduction histidine kinase
MNVEAPPGAHPVGEDPAALIARLSADKAQALARLSAGVAHELRNPLAVILARVQLLELSLKSGQPVDQAKLERALRTVEEQAVRASKIIESLSVFAHPRTPDLAAVDLAEVIGHVLAGVRARIPADTPVTTEVAVPAEAQSVVADRAQLTTALTQLVVNAVEAMPGGGVLRIAARSVPSGTEVVVADTGAGVPDTDAARIFDPFFSTKATAAGLGLCVAQTIAEAHGGRLRLTASGGPGAEFVLRLPTRG